jgi:hypothetical protein
MRSEQGGLRFCYHQQLRGVVAMFGEGNVADECLAGKVEVEHRGFVPLFNWSSASSSGNLLCVGYYLSNQGANRGSTPGPGVRVCGNCRRPMNLVF